MSNAHVSPKSGKVYLVGAGPGDPGLLTRRAWELLSTAEVIAYDALVSPSILALCHPSAELLAVGYRGYSGTSSISAAEQRERHRQRHRMHPLVIERALAGRNVVRLKSGDPWIFGRAAQECEELIENGIPFEVVPGVTAALGAAAYAGIPLTHRERSSDVVITSGHDLNGEFENNSDWNALARCCGTLVIYMAGAKVRENCARLIEMGRSAEAPAAFIANGTRGSQKVVTGSLSNLADRVDCSVGRAGHQAALLMVGETVRLRDAFRWIEKKPLHDLSVLVVRARPGFSKLGETLRAQGAEVIEAPWVESAELPEGEDSSDLDMRIRELPRYHNLLFTSRSSVDFFFKRFLATGRDSRSLREIAITALGEDVEERLLQAGIRPDRVIAGHCEQALRKEREFFRRGKNLVIISSRGRENLRRFLSDFGSEADFVSAYQYKSRFPAIEAPPVDFVILPCSTSARVLLEGPWSEALKDVPMLALGALTRQTALSLGAQRVEQAPSDDIHQIAPLLARLKGNHEKENS